jgi:O-antigen/teichoic acid export membrane protein
VASLTSPIAPGVRRTEVERSAEGRKIVRDSLIVTLGGQLERALGTFTALALRWGLDPARLGVYTGLKLFLDNTNRSSLGIGLGAVQQIPILRASGQLAEARHLANVAYTTNTLTCLLYATLLVIWAWFRIPALADDPLAAEWTWGLVAVAGLALIKRYESFLVAILRAHQEFALTAELDIVESLASGIAIASGLWIAGFWGLLAAVAVVLLVKIAYAHHRHPLRFSWAWDLPLTWRMMVEGLPILANTAVFGALLSLDRVLILWRVPNGEHAAGLYTIAIMGTSWSLDLAGRLVLVAYTAFQTTLGRTNDPVAVAKQAAKAIEVQAPVLLAGSAVAYVIAPTFLGLLMPRYVDGLVALRPLLPGMVLLGLAWPARQMLIALGRPYRLCLATSIGLALTSVAGIVGADRAGIVGVAWGMTIGGAVVFLLTSATAFVPSLGLAAWVSHLARLAGSITLFAAGTVVSAHVPLGVPRDLDFPVRIALLVAFLVPVLWHWGRRHDWGGLRTRVS